MIMRSAPGLRLSGNCPRVLNRLPVGISMSVVLTPPSMTLSSVTMATTFPVGSAASRAYWRALLPREDPPCPPPGVEVPEPRLVARAKGGQASLGAEGQGGVGGRQAPGGVEQVAEGAGVVVPDRAPPIMRQGRDAPPVRREDDLGDLA